MEITNEKIEQLAHLSKLEFDESAKNKIKVDLTNILALCEKLNDIDTEGVEPLIYLTDTINNVREDELVESISRKDALENAPKKDSDFFKVPKVISKS